MNQEKEVVMTVPKVSEYTLHNYASKEEGVVETRTWGSCTSSRCAHNSHDPYFTYHCTVVQGQELWKGERGERLIKTANNVYLTRYEGNGPYSPSMWTYKITSGADISNLVKNYGSSRHIKIVELVNVLKDLGIEVVVNEP